MTNRFKFQKLRLLKVSYTASELIPWFANF